MFMKHRTESRELIILRYLHLRMDLASKEKQYYVNLEKGFEGEKKFDELLMALPNEWLILNDLLLEMNNSEFQIDSLLFTRNTFHLFEIKNYCGDFYIEGDKWFSTSGTEIKNPLNQLQRSESLLNNLLRELRIHDPIVAHLVFINPEFTLYQAPLNNCIIFPTQLARFMKHLHTNIPPYTDKQVKALEKLTAKHLHESAYTRIRLYTYPPL